MSNAPVRRNDLARAQVDDEVVGEVTAIEDNLVTIREFGTDRQVRVARDFVEVKQT